MRLEFSGCNFNYDAYFDEMLFKRASRVMQTWHPEPNKPVWPMYSFHKEGQKGLQEKVYPRYPWNSEPIKMKLFSSET